MNVHELNENIEKHFKTCKNRLITNHFECFHTPFLFPRFWCQTILVRRYISIPAWSQSHFNLSFLWAYKVEQLQNGPKVAPHRVYSRIIFKQISKLLAANFEALIDTES